MRTDNNGLARDTFTGASTSIEIRSPDDVTGLERIMLVAQGDLQRHLSAFFARTITIECIYTDTGPRGTGASPANPIKQARQVHLKCGSKTLCIATSSVTVTSPECERLLLDEKFALGQIFRHLRVYPEFSLLDVGAQVANGTRELRRTYQLETEGIKCEIVEVFPDRDMFDLGEAWLDRDC
ncbi:hypothetical protein BD309DRAFT_945996 [Dichomitus squalens]|uniref:Uncharacterized protein n=1 Tax=Dichomitus squalens TaxID=114155 RepID=A0A4Q9QEH9_9APHY|nr:uncharacterized protein DICSQDRAFT_135446 [Dichomitus squalens LYAD-421 SS1]EJF62473.1 hypothetical protein DICSQDRAFT_135446 [Dichomitus squalens LYAD-421 SS1]TBU50149.1 hypothetical protein BD309DRAFT_945996 [Dichomitus squalens]TBU66169.1 hypothetical protein BD310DRAFT_943620 [Dichomitus squalens]